MPTFGESLKSTIISKVIVALTGLAIVMFVIVHLAGNLLIFAGPDALNKYAIGLRDLGALLWVARIGLIVCFVLHIMGTIRLSALNAKARPQGYSMKKAVSSTLYSRTMLLSGLSILAYLLFHLMHFTWGKISPEQFNQHYPLPDGRIVHDVYSMTVAGFQQWYIAVAYMLAVTFVLLHLMHAIQSAFQTIGFNHPKYSSMVKSGSQGLTAILWLGYMSIPVAIMLKLILPLP